MNNKFFPNALKDKFTSFIKYLYGSFFFLISITLALSLISFSVEDSSFLTVTSNETRNFMGIPGSYLSSFIIYTFGIMGYLLTIFFMIYSILIFFNQKPKYFFIRLLLFVFSLILIPQILMYWKIQFSFIPNFSVWGVFATKLFDIHQNIYWSYLFSFIGLILFGSSQNILKIFMIKKFKYKNLFQFMNNRESSNNVLRKDPIIMNNVRQPINTEIKTEEKEILSNDKFTYSSPSLDILDSKMGKSNKEDYKNIEENSRLLENVFADFNIEIKVVNVRLGPVVTLFEILPSAGTKINTIINLAGDISRSMGVGAVRVAQIYGTQYLGVEVPNLNREKVTIKELLSDQNFKNTVHKIPICIGKDISGNIEVIDLSKTPHLLVAGTTGSGKSVFINTLLASLLYKFSPEELRLILIDPKMLELSVYNDIAHLLTPVVTEPKKAIIALKWVCKEMERRYSLMNEENTRSLEGYNQKSIEKLPYIVVFIDEMADLMMTAGKEVEHYVQRLAQMARACGIHLVMATQRPSVDIITGSIKANFPSRISFQVASKYDSRTVLGEIGAEQLLGNGDMLMSKNGASLIRYQSAFISDNEVNKLIKEIKNSQKVQYLEELDEIIKNNNEGFDTLSDEDEELISKCINLIKSTNKASTSFLQRNFQIGYNKAARIMEALEQRGVVSPPNHTGKREILINADIN